jgi:hypothetical protein
MIREIVYEETSRGVMEPKPSPHQRRKMREAEKRKAEKREAFWGNLFGTLGLLLAFAMWALGSWLAFGGGARYL